MERSNYNPDYNNPNNNSNNNANNAYNQQQQYSYDQYSQYYYQQYYSVPQPQVPQGDPSSALSSMMYQLQQQTQQRQAMGAIAAASVSSVLGNRQQPVDYYSNYYGNQNPRSVINYDDLSQTVNTALTATKKQAATVEAENPDDLSPQKPKLCCNRWLKSAIAVAQHEKLHIKCPSCDFMCLKSALQEHEENFHGKEKNESDKKPSRPDGIIPPNAPRINTPEELEAWIAARKKNWPSKVNLERKEKEDAEKEARGELPTNKRIANKRKEQQNAKKQKLDQETSSSLVAPYLSGSDSDSDVMDPEKDAITSKDPSVMGKILFTQDRPKRRCKYFIMGKCNKGDECTFSHEKPERKPKQPRPAPTFKKRPNLLFKLLEKEILQEKNVILQCLRYIVDNNCFGKDEVAEPAKMAEDDIIAKPDTSEIDNEEKVANVTAEPLKETITNTNTDTAIIELSDNIDHEKSSQNTSGLLESDPVDMDQAQAVENPVEE